MKPAKAGTVRVPGLLDQYREQRRAWLAQADELVRMRDEVRQAAEHEALEIVTAARRDVRRIIVEARRELLVLTAQLHAAVEATDDPRIGGPTLAPLLADPEDRSRFDAATGDPLDHTRDVVLSARKEVRSVLGEARAEIEALTSEAPAARVTGAATDGAIDTDTRADPHSAQRRPEPGDTTTGSANRESRVGDHGGEALVTALDFQSRDLPIPTLAGILGDTRTGGSVGTNDADTDREQELTGGGALDGPVFDPPSPPPYGTPRLSELRNLLREPFFDDRPYTHAFDAEAIELSAGGPGKATTVETPEDADTAAAPTPDLAADASTVLEGSSETTFDAQEFTPPSRLFMSDDTGVRGQRRSARTFVGLFAATGALALLATAWWMFARTSAEPLSAATPPAIESAANAVPAASDAARSAVSAKPPESLSLTIDVRRESWIRAVVDGKDEAGRIYAAGETRHIEGAQTVSIRAGDAGAVFVGVDGAPAEVLGPNGAPATKQFVRVSPAAEAAPPVTATPFSSVPGSAATLPASTPAAAAAIAQATTRRPDAAAPAGASPQPSAAATNQTGPVAIDITSAGRPDLVQAGQQWLDAYQRRDRDAMVSSASEDIKVSDERSVSERFPAWQGSVRRDLDQVELELTGDTALLTARMTERTDGAQTAQHISRVSQIWVRRSGRWRLADVRIIGEARLNQIVR